MIQIMEGKYYRSRNGGIFGPILPVVGGYYDAQWKWKLKGSSMVWRDDGTYGMLSEFDLIEEIEAPF